MRAVRRRVRRLAFQRLVYSQLKIGTPASNFKTLQAGVFLIPNPAELTTEDTESTEAEWIEIL
jgi:hypothetical protein